MVTDAVRKNVTIDWTMRENVRAQLRVHHQAHPAQVRLPAGQTGEGDADCLGAGGVVGLGSGGVGEILLRGDVGTGGPAWTS